MSTLVLMIVKHVIIFRPNKQPAYYILFSGVIHLTENSQFWNNCGLRWNLIKQICSAKKFLPVKASKEKLKLGLSRHDLERVIHPLDYCNALYAGVSQSSLVLLQLIQSVDGGIFLHEHISPVLASFSSVPFSIFSLRIFLCKPLGADQLLLVVEV